MKKLITLLVLLIPTIAQADRAYMVLPVQGGSPAIGEIKVNWSMIEMHKTTGVYQVTGTTAAINALSKLPNALLITTVTDASTTKEVDPDTKQEVTKTVPQYSELSVVSKIDLKATNDMIAAELPAVKTPVTDTDTNRDIILKMVNDKDFEKNFWVKE